jgi:hypothetical protein
VRILVPRELPAVNGRSHKRELGWRSDDLVASRQAAGVARFRLRLAVKRKRSRRDYKSTPHLRLLKLRVSALRLFTCGETLGFITTRSVSEGFTANLRKTQKHDPSLTQRVGMTTNAQLQNARMTVCPESDLHHRSKRRCDRPNTAICCQILFQ